jgi:hypothetical protein
MEAPRIIPSRLEVKGAITSNNVAVPTASSTTTLTAKTLTTPVISGGTISGATITATGAALTAPTITLPVMSLTTTGVTSTGTGSADGAALPASPAFVTVTGATGSGVLLPTGPIGAFYMINNLFAGTTRFYCAGGSINGTTGTTAALITTTGTHSAWFFNTTATGAWYMLGNT